MSVWSNWMSVSSRWRGARPLSVLPALMGVWVRKDGLSILLPVVCQRLVNLRMHLRTHFEPPKSGERRRDTAKGSVIPKACPLSR